MIYYVNIDSAKDGNGSKERPFRHINDAAQIARAGDEVIVAPGIYREQVIPRFGGTEDARITYRSEEPLGAVITGSEVITGWKKYKGDVWTAKVDNGIFGGYNPYTTFVCGDWYFAPTVRHTGSVVLNGRMMYEAKDLKECLKGDPDPCAWNSEESRFKWFCKQEGKSNKVLPKSEYVVEAQAKDLTEGRYTVFMPTSGDLTPTRSRSRSSRAATALCLSRTTWTSLP